MVQNVAPLMRDLEAEDFYLLSGLEHGMRFGEWVDRDTLPQYSGLSPEEVQYRLDRCMDRELIERQTIQYEGYRLKFEGYDALALHTLAERESILEVGAPIGVGKEGDVLEVRGDKRYALKFHREGITNFREVRRERDYTAEHRHISWLYTARKAAEREYEILSDLHPHVAVPAPHDHNRHAIVMELLIGRELAETAIEPDDARTLLGSVISEIQAAYERGYIHADLSAYNIFVTEHRIYLIDWPQAVTTEHPNGEELLTRDIKNVVSYFNRKAPQIFTRNPDFEALSGLIRQPGGDIHASIQDLI